MEFRAFCKLAARISHLVMGQLIGSFKVKKSFAAMIAKSDGLYFCFISLLALFASMVFEQSATEIFQLSNLIVSRPLVQTKQMISLYTDPSLSADIYQGFVFSILIGAFSTLV